MRVRVNQSLCEGNAVCVSVAPAVFALGDDDQARVLIEHPEDALRAQVETAVRRCPRQALSLEEDA